MIDGESRDRSGGASKPDWEDDVNSKTGQTTGPVDSNEKRRE